MPIESLDGRRLVEGGSLCLRKLPSTANMHPQKMQPQIVPIESIDGRRLVEGGSLCLRKTADTNVDLNRNWPFAWQKAVSARE